MMAALPTSGCLIHPLSQPRQGSTALTFDLGVLAEVSTPGLVVCIAGPRPAATAANPYA